MVRGVDGYRIWFYNSMARIIYPPPRAFNRTKNLFDPHRRQCSTRTDNPHTVSLCQRPQTRTLRTPQHPRRNLPLIHNLDMKINRMRLPRHETPQSDKYPKQLQPSGSLIPAATHTNRNRAARRLVVLLVEPRQRGDAVVRVKKYRIEDAFVRAGEELAEEGRCDPGFADVVDSE